MKVHKTPLYTSIGARDSGLCRIYAGIFLVPLKDADRNSDTILMVEAIEEATYVKHHKKKIILIFSAMRNFSHELKRKGYAVKYIELMDTDNPGSFQKALLLGVICRALHFSLFLKNQSPSKYAASLFSSHSDKAPISGALFFVINLYLPVKLMCCQAIGDMRLIISLALSSPNFTTIP